MSNSVKSMQLVFYFQYSPVSIPGAAFNKLAVWRARQAKYDMLIRRARAPNLKFIEYGSDLDRNISAAH